MIKLKVFSSLFLAGFGISIAQPLYAVTWLDENLPQDDMGFLTRTYPKLIQERKHVSSEETDPLLLKLLNAPDNIKKSSIEQLMQILGKAVYDPYFYTQNHQKQVEYTPEAAQRLTYMAQGLDLGEQFLESQNRKGERTVLEEIIFKRQSNPQHTALEDIVLGAQWIDTILTRHGKSDDKVLFLGRTPCFLQVAYEELRKMKDPENPGSNILHLNFSGNPDVNSKKAGFVYKDQIKDIKRNMLTPNQLNFYENYMTRQGMDKVGDKLYLVDMIGAGGGLNSFLRVLRHYYCTVLGREKMPEVHFIALNLKLNKDQNQGAWSFKKNTEILTFESIPDKGIRPLQIKTTPIQIAEGTIKEILDRDTIQCVFTRGFEFPAERWRSEFQARLEKGGRWHKEFYENLRPEFQKILKEHQKLFSQKVLATLD